MHPIVLLLVILLVVGVLVFRRRRPSIAATDLDALELRGVDAALEQIATQGHDRVLWALAFVDDEPRLDIHAVANYMAKKWKWKEAALVTEGEASLQRKITHGEMQIYLEPVKATFPHDADNDGVAVDAGEAKNSILVTSVSNHGGVPTSLWLSQGVLALTNICPQVTSVYWMSSQQTFSRNQLKAKLGINLSKRWPTDVWVSVSATRSEKGRSDGHTLGLASMGGTEFEAKDAPESPKELRKRLAGLADYVICKYGLIYNGDTVGIDCLERIRVKKQPSETGLKGWVFQLHYEKPSPDSGWER
ncbi:MAG: hypothetical protein AAF699_14925 [Pseudomonadota bacterium]